ncbi:MAG: hypothetical protein ACTSRK_13950 [Promethearchaeota archaeon]
MISITLSFFANLQAIFGEIQELQVEFPVRIIEIFPLFFTHKNKSASAYFLDGNTYLKDDHTILLNGRNIAGMEGLSTIIDKDVELSFFPKIGGG